MILPLAVQLSDFESKTRVPSVNWQRLFTGKFVLGGQVIVGGVMSFNVTVKAQVAVLPLPSLAVSVIVCVLL